MSRPALVLLALQLVACGGGTSNATGDAGSTGGSTDEPGSTGTTGGPGTTGDPGTTTADPSPTTTPDPSAGPTSASSEPDPTTGEPGTTDATTGDPVDPVYDPDQDGPWQFEAFAGELDHDGDTIPVTVHYPTGGPAPGPYPVVTLAHGFNLPPTQYTGYAIRLATHGYVVLNVDHTGYIFGPVDHVGNAKQVLAALDWAAERPELAGVADTDRVGATGHSLGGKVSVLAAMYDARIRASITLDPVDGANMCQNMAACPDVSAMLPIATPLGFLGETLDAEGFMSCAPAADNFTTFFAEANPPALQVTVLGANHMSFLDDVAACGITCSFCKAPTLANAVVNDLARAYVVAFYGRHLRGNPGYDTYLTGAAAQERYVRTGLVEIDEK